MFWFIFLITVALIYGPATGSFLPSNGQLNKWDDLKVCSFNKKNEFQKDYGFAEMFKECEVNKANPEVLNKQQAKLKIIFLF